MRRLRELDANVVEEDKKRLNYIMPDGRGGALDFDPNCGVILTSQLTDGLIEEEEIKEVTASTSKQSSTHHNNDTDNDVAAVSADESNEPLPAAQTTQPSEPPTETDPTNPPSSAKPTTTNNY
eukprot:scaffold6049_cov35-Cyclotella_meneghiniana.AAC.1